MADAAFSKRRVFMFLVDMRNLFVTQFGDSWQTAIALQFDNQFSRTIQRRADYFSNDPTSDKITAIKTEVDAAKSVVLENIDKLLDRGEKIELLVDKTSQLQEETFHFQDKARKMKTKFWWKNVKLWVIIGVLLAVVVFFIIWFICGFPDFNVCARWAASSQSSSPPNNAPPGPPPPPPPTSAPPPSAIGASPST